MGWLTKVIGGAKAAVALSPGRVGPSRSSDEPGSSAGGGGSGGGGGVELRRVLPATHEEAYRVMERYTADLAQRAEDVRAERPPAEEAD